VLVHLHELSAELQSLQHTCRLVSWSKLGVLWRTLGPLAPLHPWALMLPHRTTLR